MDIVLGPGAAVGEGHAQGVEFLAEPTDADAEKDAATGHVVQGGDLFGADEWIMLWQDQDPGGEFDGAGSRGGVGHPDQWIGQHEVALAARDPAIARIRIRRLVAFWYNSVFDGPGGLEARRLGCLNKFDGVDGVGIAAGVAIADAKFHGALPDRGDSSTVAFWRG